MGGVAGGVEDDPGQGGCFGRPGHDDRDHRENDRQREPGGRPAGFERGEIDYVGAGAFDCDREPKHARDENA